MRYIFLHGWSFSKYIWKDFYHLNNSIFLDLPFHNGKSYSTNEKILEKFSLDLLKIINDCKEDITLIGWSLGASISVLTALNKPNKLKKLILVGFSPKFKDENLGHSPKNVKAFMIQLRKDFENTVLNFRKTAVNNEFREIPFPIKEGGINILKEFIELDLTKNIKNLNVETVFISGKEDKIINPFGSVWSNKQIKNSSLVLVNSHHAPFVENPNLILDIL